MLTTAGGGGPTLVGQSFVAYCGLHTATAGNVRLTLPVSYIASAGGGLFTATVGQTFVTVNRPGWYLVTLFASTLGAGEAGKTYQVTGGGDFSIADGLSPGDERFGGTFQNTAPQATSLCLFDAGPNNTIELAVFNGGVADIQMQGYIMATFLGPSL